MTGFYLENVINNGLRNDKLKGLNLIYLTQINSTAIYTK